MDLRKLRHATVLAEQGSFARASEVLHITQPALSRSIQALEAELGFELFNRLSTGVRPTSEGSQLLRHAEHVLREANGLMREASLLRSGEAGSLAFAVGPMFAPVLMPVFTALAQDYPRLDVRAEIKPIAEMIAMLLAEKIEFFVADSVEAESRAGVLVDPLVELPVGYHVRKGHPLATQVMVAPEELAAFPLAAPAFRARPESGRPGHLAETAWQGRFICEDVRTLKAVALSSDAVMLGMGPALEPELGRGEIVRVNVAGLAQWASHVGLVRLSGRTLSAAGRRTRDLLRSAIAEDRQ
ncbi:MAG: LysR family transcriptional regulator [Blastomonas sp.]